jgi:hypothetical protein
MYKSFQLWNQSTAVNEGTGFESLLNTTKSTANYASSLLSQWVNVTQVREERGRERRERREREKL